MLLAQQTMLGTARLMLDKDYSPEALIKAVSSAKGTTEAGMAVLGEPALSEIIAKTVHAAAERSKELSE